MRPVCLLCAACLQWSPSRTHYLHDNNPCTDRWTNGRQRRVDTLLEQDIPRLIAEVEDTYAALHHGGSHGHTCVSSLPCNACLSVCLSAWDRATC